VSRERLPPRRDNLSRTVEWRGHTLHVCIGLTRVGRTLEVFCRGGRPQSDVDQQLDDIGVLVSRLLQHGDHLAGLARGIGRLPSGEPTSLVAVVIDALELERELQ
jgi:hypothetical protein